MEIRNVLPLEEKVTSKIHLQWKGVGSCDLFALCSGLAGKYVLQICELKLVVEVKVLKIMHQESDVSFK